MLKFAVGPCHEVRGWLQLPSVVEELDPEEAGGGCSGACEVKLGSAVGSSPPTPAVATCVPWVLRVGRGGGVLVGAEVGVTVGGTVAVGIAS